MTFFFLSTKLNLHSTGTWASLTLNHKWSAMSSQLSWQLAMPASCALKRSKSKSCHALLSAHMVTLASLAMFLASSVCVHAAATRIAPQPAHHAQEVVTDFCAFDNIFGAGPPPYYVAYHLGANAGESIESFRSS